MSDRQAESWSRREFVAGLTLAGTAGLLGVRPEPVAAEPPPETTTLKILNVPAACLAPQFVAEDLLRAEGFTDLKYVKPTSPPTTAVAAGQIDLSMLEIPSQILSLDRGEAIVILAGVHRRLFRAFQPGEGSVGPGPEGADGRGD